MTEEIKSCDFYNEKICTLFSKYFGFNVECKNLSLCTVDSDDEKECPIKRLEQENKEMEKKLELDEVQLNSYFIGEEKICKENEKYRKALEDMRNRISNIHYRPVAKMKEIEELINEVLNEK